jgi:hypothetical protein
MLIEYICEEGYFRKASLKRKDKKENVSDFASLVSRWGEGLSSL